MIQLLFSRLSTFTEEDTDSLLKKLKMRSSHDKRAEKKNKSKSAAVSVKAKATAKAPEQAIKVDNTPVPAPSGVVTHAVFPVLLFYNHKTLCHRTKLSSKPVSVLFWKQLRSRD